MMSRSLLVLTLLLAACAGRSFAPGIADMEWQRSEGFRPTDVAPDRLQCMQEVADATRPVTPGFTGNTVPATQMIYEKTRRDHMARCMRDLGWNPATP